MIVIVNVAAKKKGKTTLTKGYLSTHSGNKFIYDVNNEYKEFGSGAVFPSWTDFLKQAVTKSNTAIVFEEAYIFLKHQSASEEICNLLIRTRHTGNMIILNFHSIRQVPSFVYDLTNYLVIGKTNDKAKYMDREHKDTDVYDAWFELQEHPDDFHKITLQLN